jgi:hypothetical protein
VCHRDDNFVCTKDSYICSLHFIGNNGQTKANPDHVYAFATNEKVICITVNDLKKIYKVALIYIQKGNDIALTLFN